jgi:hypothetical protein
MTKPQLFGLDDFGMTLSELVKLGSTEIELQKTAQRPRCRRQG